MKAQLAISTVRERSQLNLYRAEFICMPKARIIIHYYQLSTVSRIVEQLKGNKRPRASIKSGLNNTEGNALTKPEFSTEALKFFHCRKIFSLQCKWHICFPLLFPYLFILKCILKYFCMPDGMLISGDPGVNHTQLLSLKSLKYMCKQMRSTKVPRGL